MAEEPIQKLQAMLSKEKELDVDLLIELAPELPDPLLSQAIEIAHGISDKSKRVLAAQELATRSLKIELADNRARALIDLSSLVSDAERPAILSQAFEAAKIIEDPWTRAVTMRDLFLLWPDIAVLNEARASLDAARKVMSGPESERKLEDLSSDLSEQASRYLSQSAEEPISAFGLRGDESASQRPRRSETFRRRDFTDMPSQLSNAKSTLAGSGYDPLYLMKEALITAETRNTRIVNTGFAPESQASIELHPTTPLQISQSYYFWLEVGELLPNTIETKPISLPENLPVGARLVVAIFPFKDEIQIKPGSDAGELLLNSDGTAQVVGRKPAVPASVPPDQLNRRLFFPVSMPNRTGTFRLRCSIYYNQMLVQSRVIRACVTDKPGPIAEAIRSDIDYALTDMLRPSHLTALAPHRLSLMVNSNGDGTHTFSFLGANEKEPFKNECNINASELETLTESARNALRQASWGKTGPYQDGYTYRYQQYNLEQLKEDLILLATRGWILYDAFIENFSVKKVKELTELMLPQGGRVQIALKNSPTLILPAALFYDHPLDREADKEKGTKICDAFISSLGGKTPLEKTPCFQGKCPHYEELDYVCPSGFWGYRHILGFPPSLNEGEVPTEISFNGGLEIVVGGEYKSLQKTKQHVANLNAIRKDIDLHAPPTRNDILEELKKTKAQLIYFYCHGGYREDIRLPFLQVDDGNILGSDLRAHKISWIDPPHPLVFINGCHTTALDPRQAYNLVESFVGKGCSGVIGTEITIFEQLACDFAEECLRQFLAGNVSIGEAIRGARLELLRKGNPLGLVYTPFVTADLHLRQKSASTEGASP